MSTHKEIKTKGICKSLRLTSDWVEGQTAPSNIGFRYLIPFQLNTDERVKICFFYRGMPLSPAASEAFRKHLKGQPKVIFSESEAPNAVSETALRDLSEVLDNTSNNQVLNKEDGFQGPHFLLKQAEITRIVGKSILSVRGCFIEPGTNNRLNEYWGIFIDGKPGNAECPVEEIYFEAPSAELFQRYVNQFIEAIGSIQWRYDALDRQMH